MSDPRQVAMLRQSIHSEENDDFEQSSVQHQTFRESEHGGQYENQPSEMPLVLNRPLTLNKQFMHQQSDVQLAKNELEQESLYSR